ncbi:head-tail connector protein [Chachezhania antarctica]|uniref:head-tail connector protein n=1 Tax=Chachezhania antarctica TaxID=2340860 RepID=UPI000EB0DB00|nr:head-tail connector protein [Chachezhania antarctica]
MILNELEPIPDTSLPLEPFRAHLRLGTGFGTETLQDTVLHGFLLAAIAAIEARVSKALLRRDFEAVFSDWRDPEVQVLPIAPVTQIHGVVMEDAGGATETVATTRYRFEPDFHSPRLRATGLELPRIPRGGLARVTFRAGMADDWSGLPGDMAQAVLLLAAHYYENRSDTRLNDGCTPFGVTSLLQRYRPMRLSVGSGR